MASEAEAVRAAEAGTDLAAERQAYREDGYVLLKHLFPPIVLQMFRSRIQQDLNFHGSRDFVRTSVLLNKPAIEVYSREYAPMATFLWALTPRVSAVAGRELIPSYAYFRIYQKDDVCRVHCDRPACEHSLSLTLELGDNIPWALSMEKRHLEAPLGDIDPDFAEQPFTAIPMSAGDAVMYRGVNHRHGRLDPNPNSYSAHMFLHWVDADGPYADHAFDRANVEAAHRAGFKV